MLCGGIVAINRERQSMAGVDIYSLGAKSILDYLKLVTHVVLTSVSISAMIGQEKPSSIVHKRLEVSLRVLKVF